MAQLPVLDGNGDPQNLSANTDAEGLITRHEIPGVATSALQTTGNASLISILAAFGALATTAAVNLVTTAVEAVTAAIVARLGTLGQKAMAGSAPVTIASDQSAIPVRANSHPELLWFNGTSNAASVVRTLGGATMPLLHSMNELWMHFRIALGTLTATITFEGSLNGTDWFPLRPEPSVVIGIVASQVTLGTGTTAHVISLANPAANVNLVVPFDSPPPHVRATYACTDGGSATAATAVADAFARAA